MTAAIRIPDCLNTYRRLRRKSLL